MKSFEFIEESLNDKSINALIKAKQFINQQQAEELQAWQHDMEKKFPQLTKKPTEPPGWRPSAPAEPEVKEPFSVVNAKLKALNIAIEKYELLEKLKAKAANKGLMTKAMESDTDVSMYVPQAYKDGYKSLNDKLDKSIQIVQQRLNINKLAYRE